MSWVLLKNSVLVAGVAAILAGCLGFSFALFASGLSRFGRLVSVSAAIAAFVLPPFLVTNTWLNYFGLNGTWRRYVDFEIYSLSGTVLLLALLLWPLSFLLSLAALLRIDAAYLEQEPFLRGPALLRYVAWPASRSGFGCALVLSFVLALNNFTIPALLQTKVYAAEVWLSFNTKFDYAEALGLSWPLILGPLLLLAALRFKADPFVFRTTTFPTRVWRDRLSLIFPICGFASVCLILVSLLLPLAQLVTSSRTWSEFIPALAAGKSAAWNSFLFAISSALVVIVAGVFLRRYRFAGASWLLFLTPGVLLGIALIWILNRPGTGAFYQSAGVVVLAFGLRYLALGWTGARAGYSAVEGGVKNAVAVFGGTKWEQFRLAEWPQSRLILLGAFYITYLLCLWEVETLVLIVPPGRETLALRIFNMLHYGHAGQVNALCVLLIAMGVAPLVLFSGGAALLRRMAVLAILPLLLSGCGAQDPSRVELKSKLFSSVQVFGSRGTGAGQFNKPRSVAVDREDNFYVVDMTGRVQKFSPEGNFLFSWQMPQTDKGKPKGMACDLDGNIIVVEPHYSRVNHFSPQGKLLAQWGENGTNRGQLFFPRSVAVNSHGEIFLSEYGMVERIQHFSHRGTNFFASIGQPGTGPGELNRAEGIGIGPEDNLFVADSCNHRVQILSPEGKMIVSFGTAGSGPNEMSYPYDVRVDAFGNRYVCEFGNSRVQVFDAQNRSVEILGGAGAEPGRMNNPWAIALDAHGNLYVADSLNHRVQKFMRRGAYPSPVHTQIGVRSQSLAAK